MQPSSTMLPLLAGGYFIRTAKAATLDTGSCTIDQIVTIIDQHFDDVGSAGTPVWHKGPANNAIDFCLGVGYDQADEETFVELRDELFPSCGVEGQNPENPTCKAITAVYNSFVELEKAGCTPLFRNYLPAWTDWDQNKVACESGSFDIESKSFVEGKENGCNGFALCNIFTTVLTLSANQRRTGTCGTTAMFTVLSKAGPVRSLALAVELLWTGKTSYLDEEPCAYIYDLSPGVQALPNPGSSLEEVCGKNPTGDCQNYYYGHANVASDVNAPVAFIQGPEIEYMFTQAFSTAYFRRMTGGCSPEGNQLIKPDFSNNDIVESYQGTTIAALVYYCKGMVEDLDYDCSLLSTSTPINPFPGLSKEAADYWFAMPGVSGGEAITQLEMFGKGELAPTDLTNMNALDFLEGLLCSISPDGALSLEDFLAMIAEANPPWSPSTPRITEVQLNSACATAGKNEEGVVLSVNSGPFNDINNGVLPQIPKLCVNGSQPYCEGQAGNFPLCDHVVVLDSCDIEKGEYNIWTWAKNLTVPKDVLVADPSTGIGGSICAVMTAAPSDGTYTPPEPVPCNSGVCNAVCQLKGGESNSDAANRPPSSSDTVKSVDPNNDGSYNLASFFGLVLPAIMSMFMYSDD